MKEIEVDLPLKVSTNDFYSKHWAEKGKITKKFQKAIWDVVREQKITPIEEYPIEMEMTFYLLGRPVDNINLSSMAKQIEDGLRYSNILKDDTSQYVESIKLSYKKSDKKYHYAKIKIKKAESSIEHLRKECEETPTLR